MISYDPKAWLEFLFRFHRTDTIRRLFVAMLLMGGYAAGVTVSPGFPCR